MSGYDWYIAIVDLLILIGVWLELWLYINKKRKQQIKRTVTLTLRKLCLTHK